jgi:chromosome segregation ATPase
MMSGFNANVALRKPRTTIGRVLSEMTAQPETEETVARAAPPAAEPDIKPEVREVREEPKKPASERAPGSREQVERLRERLAAAARPPIGAAEPQQTAAAVKEVIDGLRARLEGAVKERAELSKALDEARAALGRAEKDLQKEKKMRAAVETQAEDRQRIADDAVAEAEALASERDHVLADLAEHRRLESEQGALLNEAEIALGKRDAERSAAARELAEARQLLSLRTADMADLEARLRSETADRVRMHERCRELEAEVARLSRASDALESIEAITRGR